MGLPRRRVFLYSKRYFFSAAGKAAIKKVISPDREVLKDAGMSCEFPDEVMERIIRLAVRADRHADSAISTDSPPELVAFFSIENPL